MKDRYAETGLTFRFVRHSEDGNIEHLAVGLRAVEVFCRQDCAKGDKGGAELLVE